MDNSFKSVLIRQGICTLCTHMAVQLCSPQDGNSFPSVQNEIFLLMSGPCGLYSFYSHTNVSRILFYWNASLMRICINHNMLQHAI